MDFLFHTLTGVVMSKAAGGRFLPEAIAFSLLPDALGMIVHEYHVVRQADKTGIRQFVRDVWVSHKQGIFKSGLDKTIYKATHSWFMVLPISMVARLAFGEQWMFLASCYLLHLGIDLFTHQDDYAQQPLYPLRFTVQGWDFMNHRGVFLFFWTLLLFSYFAV